MKIAVYTIALNEEQNVQEWYDSAKDADYLLIADTGSTDKTIRLAKKLGIHVFKISVKPWRFDDARNAALALLPDDIDMCISLDMDERLSDGWREKLESIEPDVTQIFYKYVWGYRDPQSRTQPQSVVIINKVHARHGYRWKYLVHELPFPDRNENHKEHFLEDFEIYHHAIESKRDASRYSKLISDCFEENKDTPRYWEYKIATLVGSNNAEAKKMILEYLNKFKKELENYKISEQYRNLFILTNERKYLYKAARTSPKEREHFVDIALFLFNKKKYRKSAKYCKKALEITERRLDFSYKEYVWGYLAKNMLYVANHNKKFKNRNNQLFLNTNTLTSSSFDLFKDQDVL